MVGLSMSDVERPPTEWDPYLEPYRIKIHELRKRAHEAGVLEESRVKEGEVGAAAWTSGAANSRI